MTRAEKVIVEGVLGALALTSPAVLFHAAPRFPGSLVGSSLGIAAATLFVLLLSYAAAKRQPWLRGWLKGRLSLGALLTFHVYAGTAGALLGIVHSGHKLQSPLGIALMASMVLVVGTGFVGRYLLAQVSEDLRTQQGNLAVLRDRYDSLALAASDLTAQPVVDPSGAPIDRLLGAISDLEFAIAARDLIKRSLRRWVIVHIVAAICMYAALALHVLSGVYYGLRWL